MKHLKPGTGNIFLAIHVFIAAAILLPVSCLKAESGAAEKTFIEGPVRITEEELVATLGALPEDIRLNIIQYKSGFTSLLAEVLKAVKDDGNFILYPADRSRMLEESFEPSDLVSLDNEGFLLNKEGMKIRKAVMSDLKEMAADAASEGLRLVISSAFRSYDYQKKLYSYYMGVYGPDETDRFSAPPGASQHQLGTAIDFGSVTLEFRDTNEGKWMTENSRKYGFSLSYPEGLEDKTGYMYEPWHFRYITRPGAALERDYFGGLQYLFLDYLYTYGNMLAEKISTEE